MTAHHSVLTYIKRAYTTRHEPESMHVLAELYWWTLLTLSIILLLTMAWYISTLYTSTFDIINGHMDEKVQSVEQLTGIDPKKFHMEIINIDRNTSPGVLKTSAASDPSVAH